MKFSFGIVTDGNSTNRLNHIVDTIENTMRDNYEIIIVGGENIKRNKTRVISYDEGSDLPKIAHKKNIITSESKFENIVYLHDYIEFCEDWYRGFEKFGNDFSVCMNKILNNDLTRYRDWCLWMDDADLYVTKYNYLIPYSLRNLTRIMYISGAYWVAKKKFMSRYMLNENLKWGQGEDVEWSLRVREHTEFKMNENSTVKLMKQKNRIFNEVTGEEINTLEKIKNFEPNDAYEKLIKNHLSKWIEQP